MANFSQSEVQTLTTSILASKTLLTISTVSVVIGTSAMASEQVQDNSKDQTEVITVIGEKVARTIYETSSSVRVYDEETIRSTPNATELDDLLQLTPNLVDVGQSNSLPSIRGADGSGPSVGGLASFAGTAPRLNLSIDGRSLTYSEIAFGPRSLWDIEQVEVHLGPQSYVQGRNASAGAIVIKSKDPEHHFESSVKGGYGEHDYSQTAAMFNAPIVEDQLAFRLSVDQQKRRTDLPLATYEPAGDSRRVEMTTARAKLLFEPARLQGMKTVLTVEHMDTRSPQSENEIGLYFPKERPVYETKATSGIWVLDWQINDEFVFENNLIVTEYEYERTTNPLGYRADFITKGDEFSVEPIVRYNASDDILSALFGARYFTSKQDDEYTSTLQGYPMAGESDTISVFAEATYSISPVFDLTVAGRFEKENKKRSANVMPLFNLDYDDSISVFLPKLDIAYKPKNDQTIGFKIGKGYNSGGAGLSFNRFARAPMKPYAFDKEFVWNYEFYTRHSLAGGNVVLTSNVFFNDYDGMQIQQYLPDGYVQVQNLDHAQTYGAELGISWMATYDLELFAALGLLKTDYKQSAIEGGESKELPRAPALSGNVGALYAFSEDFEASFNASYTGAYYSDLANSDVIKIDPYWVANAQLSYLFSQGRANIFVQNMFDEDNVTEIFDTNSIDEPLRQAPRMIGASVEFFF
ncbi:TonB-dependent receptor domain-containing protein [Vibrio sp. TRT 17S01]|uniref:TonB-dependent receptor domain-containing protein n=1 Tax=Vibrio sp. TRT 17S01 TaxID=3418505 RepID=UPI003CE8F304